MHHYLNSFRYFNPEFFFLESPVRMIYGNPVQALGIKKIFFLYFRFPVEEGQA